MERIRITDRRVADALAMRVLVGNDYEEYLTDADVKGFQVRITKTRKALAYLQYWREGRSKKLPLGEIGRVEDGKLTVVEARKKASAARGVVDAGGDPHRDRVLKRERLKASTFEDAWTLFTASWSDEDRFRRETKALIKNDALPAFGGSPLVAVKKGHIIPVIEAVEKRSKARARALFNALRLCFNWCVERELIEHSPMPLKGPKPVKARDHYLNEREIAACWRATGQLGFPWQPIFRLLMLTGTRRAEAASLEWRELDGDVWTIPPSKTKNDFPHVIDLPPLLVEILNSVPKMQDADGKLQQLAFSTTGTTAPSGFSNAKKRLDGLMRKEIGEFRPFKFHDFRRTIVTTLNEDDKILEEVGERILNHKKKGIVKVYNKATLRKQRKEALLEWSNYVINISSK